MYRLQFLNGKFKGKRLTIQQGAILIGRDPECQIDLDDDDEVSRHHAVIEFRGGGPVIRDLGAKNPLQVNQQVVKEHRLHSGDRIEIGRTVIEFQSGTSSAPPRHRRKFSKMQAVSYVAIGLIILLQVVFVVLFPLWQKRETVPVVVVEPEKPAPKPVATPPVTPAPTTSTVAVAVPGEPAVPAETVAPPDKDAVDTALLQALEAAVTTRLAKAAGQGTPVPAPDSAEASDLPPAQPAPAMSVPDPQVQEVMALRSEIEDLRRQVENIGAPPSPPGRTATESRPDGTGDDPLVLKSREMLAEAQREIERMNYFQADNILERIQMMSPEFVPAYRERAVLYEARGMLKQAGDQWQRVMKLTAGSPLYEQAAAERQRIARMELTNNNVTGPVQARTTSRRLEKRIRIASVERERFRANEEYDEMRMVRVTLRPRNNEGEIDADKVQLVAVFYDRVAGSDRLVPTRALVPDDSLRISGSWPAGEARSVSAAYIVGKGFRDEEERLLGERREYEGYRIMVYYRGKLQDESAMPTRILELEPPPAPGTR